MNKLKARVIPVLVFALSALATLAVAEATNPPPHWPGACGRCEPYAHSDTTMGGCKQCCEDCTSDADPTGDMGWLGSCEYCCTVRNGGDPSGPQHCQNYKEADTPESDSNTL